MSKALLNVAAVRPRTCTNGPGWRAAVWVQGCSIRCPGCFNPHTHPHEPRHLWDPDELAARLLTGAVEGLTILGGEPFEQAAACARLARAAQDRGASVVTYSGHTWTFLRRTTLPAVRALLGATDLLVAGPFVAAQATDGRAWHGSGNQELVFLTGRYDASVLAACDDLPVAEVWTDGGTATWSGIPGRPAAQPLEAVLRPRSR
jgi:anaerobic ribonucleoside-triphosphate reductase activating protein